MSILLRRVTQSEREAIEYMLNEHVEMLAPGFDRLNAGPFYADPRNVGFAAPDDCAFALFEYKGGGIYGAHLLCDFPWRGAHAVEFGREAVSCMFTDYAATNILAEIPCENVRSRIVCRAIGGTPDADTVDETGRLCKIYRLGRDQWARLSAEWHKG